jgi:hypothetical protein
MSGFFIMFGIKGLVTHPGKQSIDEEVKQKTEFELKDIVINRNLYGGKMITAARKELERRGILLTDSEKQQQEANKQARIEQAKKNTRK